MKITSCNGWPAIADLKPACDLKIVKASYSFIVIYLIICISVPFYLQIKLILVILRNIKFG